jgi:signal transduction histidine kinase
MVRATSSVRDPRGARRARPAPPTNGPSTADTPVPDSLAELRFLHQVIRLATTAGSWDELLSTVVDETRDALRADITSLYLLDRDGRQLTLAATNGLDKHQIGRAQVPFGAGITGQVAASREPMVIPDVRSDPRFLWVRGIDQRRFVASMLSVPLSWHDQVVGVLNAQTEQLRDFTSHDVAQLSAIADLLAGIVEKGRLQREAEAQVEQLKALDRARNELIALVTHELRTPLAVVRAYADLLADEPLLDGRDSRDPARREQRTSWHLGTIEQIDRLDRLVDSILASVRVESDQAATLAAVDIEEVIHSMLRELQPLLHRHTPIVSSFGALHVVVDGSRLRKILEHLLENAVKFAPPETRIWIDWQMVEGVARLGITDEGPGIPEEWRERIFEPYARRETQTARGSGIGLFAAKRLAQTMGSRLWSEPALSGGARFVLAMPAALAV